ncbi:uncharacterized protein LOC124988873 isoform X2 [Sciurus carolinensis]|nr:uncharacterized protein LOC124988873 isoform X2 [Sciurus carolinensis]XP_047414640.1 uncharacterized protein LOC124988873 isoform X2 [Sciurus carolinensis]
MKKLIKDGSLMFQQVPMVEIDGMKLVQTRAILNYIATKYNLYGKDVKERALIDMYSEGVADLNEIILHYPFLPPGDKDESLTQIKEKSRNRYFPAFEKRNQPCPQGGTRCSSSPSTNSWLPRLASILGLSRPLHVVAPTLDMEQGLETTTCHNTCHSAASPNRLPNASTQLALAAPSLKEFASILGHLCCHLGLLQLPPPPSLTGAASVMEHCPGPGSPTSRC